ncbi:hybrid-cluster NAD(P)-dependent oxidoreductase [Paraburkholderia phenazinium]|uniref:Ferredoxin-NADP reductase n=1 Tax=Paraburkholderia phenazinium TaxID=60549 RepID=A0A1N6I800_9BURK|nr:hybrid-cluster NAD(P)-dependent oxidoreductase [Paraburkholderia phenazinium]SIO28075.1 Ferredoxin-NADP reductase [Paraburkholderia phenazinium]
MTGSPFVAATCIDIRRENWNVKTFRFRVANPDNGFDFEAGQYVTLGLEIGGETVYRCYTVSCAPENQGPGEFEITVKHSPGGLVSTWLHETLKAKAKVQVSRATGDFVLPDDRGEPLLFIAGGVGITPLMSMARHLHAQGKSADIQFLQFARTPGDILFRDELREMDASSNGIVPHLFASHSSDSDCQAGRLCTDLLDKIVPGWKSRTVLCCGPDSFMADMREAFVSSGGDPTRFHQESFNVPDSPPAHVVTNTGVSTVRLSESGFDVSCEPGKTVLEAVHASPHGVKIPNACRSGVCGTCKLRMLDGNVDMQHNGGITDEEVDEGYILTCCSVPLSNITIEY